MSAELACSGHTAAYCSPKCVSHRDLSLNPGSINTAQYSTSPHGCLTAHKTQVSNMELLPTHQGTPSFQLLQPKYVELPFTPPSHTLCLIWQILLAPPSKYCTQNPTPSTSSVPSVPPCSCPWPPYSQHSSRVILRAQRPLLQTLHWLPSDSE